MREHPRPITSAEHTHDGAPVTPKPAATVLVLRGGDETLEVLMVQRHHGARFMGGVWVFPGGAVDQQDGPGPDGVRIAARREVLEETGIVLDAAAELVTYSRWVTPRDVRRRFDTWFFLAPAPETYEVTLSAGELVDHRWITPAAALELGDSGEMLLVLPTIKTLQSLLGYASATAAFSDTEARDVRPMEPRVVGDGDTIEIVLPDDPGYPS
jgi:8-oxo-dGTP pyrophosphatase MutT (NUDIX family)